MASVIEQVDQLFAAWDRSDTPGCALAVMQHGEIIYTRGYGMANLEYDIPIESTTVFHAASISKQFTAMAISLLAHEGKLTLDDDVRRYLPELHDFGSQITIRHLIHHTGGLRDQWELLLLAGWRLDDVITTDDVLKLIWRQRQLNFEPGTEYAYCNSGYTLLAQIVERVTGTSFRDFCAQRIFTPLGMRSSHFHDDHTTIVKGRAYSYAPTDDGAFCHAVLSYATVGATSLFTTVTDLALWDENFYTPKVGGKAVIEQVHACGVLNNGEQISYAFGLQLEYYKGLPVVEHSGGDAGYRGHVARFPEQHFSVAILGNIATLNPWKLARQVADIYLADMFTASETSLVQPLNEEKGITLSEEQLASKAGVYYHASTVGLRRLELQDGKLITVAGFRSELIPIQEHVFQLATSPQTMYRFIQSADRPLQLHEQTGPARPMIYELVTLATFTRAELTAYVGVYESDELGVTYELLLSADQLVVQPRRHGSIPLSPLFADGFATDFGHTLLFSRDDSGAIAGFSLSTGRVRHLRFARRVL
jgi:CubicO group peptidase (beta-lactamase class C family)